MSAERQIVSVHPINTWQQERLVDEAVDAYVDWRDQCTAVSEAYRRWASAPVADAGSAFAAYSAALDREASAAEVYAAQLMRMGHAMPTELG